MWTGNTSHGPPPMPNADTTNIAPGVTCVAQASRGLVAAADARVLERVCDELARALFEEFPEASLELIRDLLLRALDGGAICAGSAAALAGDGVAGLEIRLDAARVVEFLASALRAGQGNRAAHGQPLSELIDVEERQSYPAGADRQARGEGND